MWLKSAESKLREDYGGCEDFLGYAVKQFRHLKTEEKQVKFRLFHVSVIFLKMRILHQIRKKFCFKQFINLSTGTT